MGTLPADMIVMVCLDDKNGMMFNHRRQSQDRLLRQHILELAEGRVLRMNPYSARQFEEAELANVVVSEGFLTEGSEGEYCFVENEALLPYEEKMERLIVFRWNKTYPADLCLDLKLDSVWKLTGREEFQGYSHDVITMEVYER